MPQEKVKEFKALKGLDTDSDGKSQGPLLGFVEKGGRPQVVAT